MGVDNLAQFSADLDSWINVEVPAEVVAFQKKVHLLVLGCGFSDSQGNMKMAAGLLEMTPVDTGTARANWISSVGAPSGGIVEVEGIRQRNRAALPADFIGAPASAEETDNAMSALAGLKFGENSYIVNNLEYISILEDGGVNRVGHHMVSRSIINAEGVLANG